MQVVRLVVEGAESDRNPTLPSNMVDLSATFEEPDFALHEPDEEMAMWSADASRRVVPSPDREQTSSGRDSVISVVRGIPCAEVDNNRRHTSSPLAGDEEEEQPRTSSKGKGKEKSTARPVTMIAKRWTDDINSKLLDEASILACSSP